MKQYLVVILTWYMKGIRITSNYRKIIPMIKTMSIKVRTTTEKKDIIPSMHTNKSVRRVERITLKLNTLNT